MAKILETQFEKGSLIDAVSGDLLTNSGATLRQGENGTRLDVDTNKNVLANVIDGEPFPGEGYIAFSFSANRWAGSSSAFCNNSVSGSNVNTCRIEETAAGTEFRCIVGSAAGAHESLFSSGFGFEVGADYHIVFAWDASELFLYINGTLNNSVASTIRPEIFSNFGIGDGINSGRDLSGEVYKCIIGDSFPDNSEIDDLYAQFLNRTQLSTETKNFTNHKPEQLSAEGLVAAYNMIPSEGRLLVDISGNGNNGDISGALATDEGMNFSGSGYIGFTEFISGFTELSICLSVNITNKSAFQTLVDSNSQFSGNVFLETRNTGELRVILRNIGSSNFDEDFDVLNLGVNNLVVTAELTGSAVIVNVYNNGVLVGTQNQPNTTTTIDSGAPVGIGALRNVARFFEGDFLGLCLFYSRALGAEEAKAYHNQFASQAAFSEDFRYAKADGTNQVPEGWIKGSGDFKISEDENGKSLECVTAGTIATQSNQAYGTWEFDIEKSNLANTIIRLISENKEGTGARYSLVLNSGFFLFRDGTSLFSGGLMVAAGVRYGFRITRTTDGEFSVFARGGAFGDNYVLVGVSSGSNPVTDNTYADSSFFVFSESDNAKLSNILFKDGVVVT